MEHKNLLIEREQLEQCKVAKEEQDQPTHLLPSPVPPRKSLLSRQVPKPGKETESKVRATDLPTTTASSECKT